MSANARLAAENLALRGRLAAALAARPAEAAPHARI